MGSTFAGVQAGVIASLVYIGSLSLFNVALLYALKGDVLNYITANFSLICPPVSAVNSTSVLDCFDALAPDYVPPFAFTGFVLTLVYSAIFGRLYERIPGRGQTLKGLFVAPIAAINLVLFQSLGLTFVGFTFELLAAEAVVVALVASTMAYGLLLGKLYRRYTRVVSFVSQDDSSLRIMVDRNDFTGRTMTLAAKSVHNLEARVTGESSFKGWTVSGGVAVEDPKSFETSMEVNGDGLLKAQVSKKY